MHHSQNKGLVGGQLSSLNRIVRTYSLKLLLANLFLCGKDMANCLPNTQFAHIAACNNESLSNLFQKAMCRLIQGHELELAVAMGKVLGNLEEHTTVAMEMLSRKCEHLGKWLVNSLTLNR